MGPQLDSCGRIAALNEAREKLTLQWGRNLIVAEGLRLSVIFLAGVRLQWGRNLIVAEGRKFSTAAKLHLSFNGAAT